MKFTILFIILCIIITVKSNIISKQQLSNISKFTNKFNVPANNFALTENQNKFSKQKILPLQAKLIKQQRKPISNPGSVEHPEIVTTEEEKIDQTTIHPEEGNFSNENVAVEQNDGETPTVITEKLYELTLTIEYPWSKDLTVKTSEKFNALSHKIDLELTSLIDNNKSGEFMPRGSFQLLNALPSTLDNHLFVNIVFEIPRNITSAEIYEMIELRSLMNSKLYDIGLKMLGMSHREVTAEELQKFINHVECNDLNVCRLTEQGIEVTSQSSTNSNENNKSVDDDVDNFESNCSPRDTIHRSGTSIYIFDNQKCVNHVKNGKFSNECIKKSSREVSEEENSDDDMDTAPSNQHEEIIHPNEEEETVIVVRKKGNKVLIEF